MILVDNKKNEIPVVSAVFFRMTDMGIAADFRTTIPVPDRRIEALAFLDIATNAYVCGTRAQYFKIDTDWKMKTTETSEALRVPPYSIVICNVENHVMVFSTMDAPEDYLGCLACFGGILGGNPTPAALKLTSGLPYRLKCANEPFYPIRTKVQLFMSGLIALTANSQEEYQHLMDKLHHIKYVTDATVRADCWDDLCKYVFYNTETRRISARFRIPDGVDTVMGVRDFLGE